MEYWKHQECGVKETQYSNTPILQSPIAAFARSELLILLGLVIILSSVVVPTIWAARQREQLDQVYDDFQLLTSAMDRYFNEYYAWPSDQMGESDDARYGLGQSNAEVINILQARSGAGNTDHRMNMNRIVFLEAQRAREGQSGLTMDGAYLDPWGTPYELVLDTDADGHCYAPDSIYGKQPDEDFLIWSCGPDKRSGSADDILGWRRTKKTGTTY